MERNNMEIQGKDADVFLCNVSLWSSILTVLNSKLHCCILAGESQKAVNDAHSPVAHVARRAVTLKQTTQII